MDEYNCFILLSDFRNSITVFSLGGLVLLLIYVLIKKITNNDLNLQKIILLGSTLALLFAINIIYLEICKSIIFEEITYNLKSNDLKIFVNSVELESSNKIVFRNSFGEMSASKSRLSGSHPTETKLFIKLVNGNKTLSFKAYRDSRDTNFFWLKYLLSNGEERHIGYFEWDYLVSI